MQKSSGPTSVSRMARSSTLNVAVEAPEASICLVAQLHARGPQPARSINEVALEQRAHQDLVVMLVVRGSSGGAIRP